MTTKLRLYTFSISHFSEKIRWTLAHERIPFDEIAWTPALHVAAARTRGGRTTVPILEADGKHVQDSTAIIEWLDANRGPLSLLPRDESERREVMAIEARFDEVGSEVIRVCYDHVFPKPGVVVRLWTLDANAVQAAFVRLGFPFFRTVFRRRFGMGPERIVRSRASIESGLTFVESRLASGATYLVGGRFTLADVTAASLLSPLAGPDEHPVYGSARYREQLVGIVEPWRERPALEWVRRMYREHRGEWARAKEIRGVIDRA